MKENYLFGLFDGETLLDTTNIEKNDPEFARHLFFDEYGWDAKLNRGDLEDPQVKLIKEIK